MSARDRQITQLGFSNKYAACGVKAQLVTLNFLCTATSTSMTQTILLFSFTYAS